MRIVKHTILLFSVVMIALLVYSFLFGKLFPFSPVIIGFVENEFEHSIIYVQNGANYTSLKEINDLIPAVESFHELKFLRKPRIFIFKDSSSYYQRTITKARFCVYYNGNLVISPWAIEEAQAGEISLPIYLTHELSHSLIHQHSGIIRAMQYPEWFLEGLAVYSAHQMGTSWYPSKTETYASIRKGYFMPPEYFKTSQEDQVKLNVKHRIAFMYSEFACIVDYLVKEYGKQKLLAYMKLLMKNEDNNKTFKEIFGVDFKSVIHEFKRKVHNH